MQCPSDAAAWAQGGIGSVDDDVDIGLVGDVAPHALHFGWHVAFLMVCLVSLDSGAVPIQVWRAGCDDSR